MNSGFGFYTGSPSLSQALESVPTELLKKKKQKKKLAIILHTASRPSVYERVIKRCAVVAPPPPFRYC